MMPSIQNNLINTPALVLNEEKILSNCSRIREISRSIDINVLFSVKSISFVEILSEVSGYVDGYSVSSLFEALTVNEIMKDEQEIHIVSPCMSNTELYRISKYCDYIVFNSITSYENRNKSYLLSNDIGLRINPLKSFVKDHRYDPCRTFSKLGISISELKKKLDSLLGIDGLHFHTNCESESFFPLLDTVSSLDRDIKPLLRNIKWINLGGGYLFTDQSDYQPLIEAVSLLQNKYNLSVYMEPGKAFVKDSGCLVSSVIDLFESDGKQIAVLDTTVNHAPEVFEYQYSPDVEGHTDSGKYEYVLAGCSCLAGDLFGEYRFDEPLEIGSRIVFEDMAAYSLVKANMFNGINLPTVYKYSEQNGLELIKEYTYEDYRSRLGEISNETLRKRIKNTRYKKSSKVTSISRG